MPPYEMYSGYETVDAAAGRNLFYWLVTAAASSDTAPLVLWLTGGPGCSSLYALATEHGFAFPNPSDPTQLTLNPYSWNSVANMLYLEAPAGVGFSFAMDGNYTTGDDQVAADNHAFLAAFIASYPEYAGRPFFIAGESYAGHYVPQLAALLASSPIPGLNFTGFSVGNPSFDAFFDGQFYWPHMAYHGLLSNAQYAQAAQVCNGTFAGTLSPACSTLLASFRPQLVGVNPYSIYSPCDGPPSLDGGCLTTAATLAAAAEEDARSGVDGHLPRARATNLGQTVVPCMNVSAPVAYFSQQAVRDALHVDPRAHVWDVCSVYLHYSQYATTVRPIYTALKDQLHVLVYSGDVDTCVPYLGTEAAVDSLGLPVAMPYSQWKVPDATGVEQVAGYSRNYTTGKTFYYQTILGAGHMAPTFKPAQSLALFTSFLQRALGTA